jgi:hypothetical protein
MDSHTEAEYHFHPRVKVDNRLVDENIAELMRVVWAYGIRTVNCCQGGPESSFVWAWIQFFELADGMKFLEGTAYLAGWKYGDVLHMYLTPPIIPQVGPSPMVLLNPALLPEITKLWTDGTAKKPEAENKG